MERLGREMDFIAATQKPPRVAVEREAIEAKDHLVPPATINPLPSSAILPEGSWTSSRCIFAGLGPILFGFGNNPETRYFYGQAASEAALIATTDCNAASVQPSLSANRVFDVFALTRARARIEPCRQFPQCLRRIGSRHRLTVGRCNDFRLQC